VSAPALQTAQTPQCATKTAQLPVLATAEQILMPPTHAPSPYSDVP
jgi:hypothetical protein